MGKTQKKITDYEVCPHCGDDFAYYTRVYAYGWLQENTLFEDRQPYNSGMHDSLSYGRRAKYYYCYECNKRICKVEDPE